MKMGSRSAVWWKLVAVVGLFVLSTSQTTAQNITELEQRVEILEVEVVNMEDDIDDIEIDVVHQDSRITVVEVTAIQHTNDIADLTVSIDDTEDSMALLLERMAVLEATNNLLQERVGILEGMVEEQEQINEEQTQTIANLEGDLQEVEIEVQDAALRLTSVEEEVSVHDSELSSITEDMSVLENTVDDVEDEMTLIGAQNVDIQERLTILEDAVIIPWVACASSPCDNGATCIDVNIDTFVCMCRDGYYGDSCQYTPTEACASSPCTNGGTCIDVNVETFTCSCRDGFFGTTCDQSFSGTSFLATFYDDILTPTDPIVFGLPILNPGRHYDATTGIYTVPLDGIYEFVIKIQSYSDYDIRAWLAVDGVDVTYTWAYGDSGLPYRLLESVVVLSLTAGEQVWVRPNAISSMYGAISGNGMYSWFSGHLVYAV